MSIGPAHRVFDLTSTSWRDQCILGDRWRNRVPLWRHNHCQKSAGHLRVQNRTYAQHRRRYQRLVSN